MPSCVFRKCKNYFSKAKKDDGVSYHTFPSDELTKHEWVKIVQAERSEHDWLPAKRSTVCSAHFHKEDFYTSKKGYVLLKKSAVPVVLSVAAATANDSPSRAASPNSLNNVDISDLDSVFEPPKEAILKRKLEAEQMKNKKLMQNNKALKQRVKRLMRTCKNLKEALRQCTKVMTNLKDVDNS